ncbi:MAG: thermonuclease family protein [Verrucomicrobia bacterium]|nr:thermonuclease family protein [Verrucomicrobiota bacterium]
MIVRTRSVYSRLIIAVLAISCVLAPLSGEAAKRWYKKENCEYVPNPANDGDSFHVRYKRKRFLFRLYWVDTPESDKSLPERVAEQAAYWGISEDDTVRIGKKATKFTEKFLENGFTVYTKHGDALGRSARERIYATVEVDGQDLAEALVEQGLARIYGFQELPPDGPTLFTMRNRLKDAEREAKAAGLGAWGCEKAAVAQGEATAGVIPDASPDGPLEPRTLTTESSLVMYSLKESNRQVGILRAGAKVSVLKEESPGMIRVRFQTSSGKVYEAQCRRSDLGI